MTGERLTAGRAEELYHALGALEGRITARLDELEARVAQAQALPLELIRREAAAHLELYKELATYRRETG